MADLFRTSGLLPSPSNLLLAKLDPAALALIRPHCEEITSPPGTILVHGGETLRWIYFPRNGVVSLQERSGTSIGIEVGLVGSEGMLGYSGLLGCATVAHTASVGRQSASLLRLEAAAMHRACMLSPSLNAVLLRYVHVMIVQMSRAMASHLHDPLIRRLCRWLLMRHDRAQGDEFAALHDDIGTTLDVRRASITDGLHVLEGDRLIGCCRGRITIRDRGGLEMLAGDAYGAPEAQYRELIGAFGKSAGSRTVPSPMLREEAAG